MSERIVGGDITTTKDYPYQTILFTQDKNTITRFCGASIINSRFALTAGHCLRDLSGAQNQDTPTTNLYIGSSTKFSQLSSSKKFKVKSYTIHPTFSINIPNSNRVDMAVMELENEISFDSSKNIFFCVIRKL